MVSKKQRKGLENALVTVLLILIAIAAVSLISYYFFGLLRHSFVSSYISINNVQMVGGIVTGDILNQGNSNITEIIIQVHTPGNSTPLTSYVNSSVNISPGQTYSFVIGVKNAISGNNYVIIVTVKYNNGNTYSTSIEVTDNG